MMGIEAVREALTGPVASMRTPFCRDGRLDEKGIRAYIDFSIDAGSKAIMVTAGDSHCIIQSDAEIAELNRICVEHTRKRALVIAADRNYHTRQALEFADYVRDLGADVLMLMPPDWASACTAETLARHYTKVSERIPVMIVTNVFAPRGEQFGVDTLRATVELGGNVVAIKDDVCGTFAARLSDAVYGRWAEISGGWKRNHLNHHPYGCDGYLSTFISFKPKVAWRYWEVVRREGVMEAAKVVQELEAPFSDYIRSLRGGFDAAIHGMLEIYGIARRWRPAPYYTLNDEEMEALSGFLQGHGLL
jgi:4-hydroxy-tetrahydrodipicolinate synthase